jgi:hypothetical protein
MPIFRDALDKAYDAGQNFDSQFFYKERHVLYKNTQEPRVEVLWGKCLNYTD